MIARAHNGAASSYARIAGSGTIPRTGCFSSGITAKDIGAWMIARKPAPDELTALAILDGRPGFEAARNQPTLACCCLPGHHLLD
jgi:hypothetical protein